VVKRYDQEQERYEKWVFLEHRLVGALLIGSRENLAFARRSETGRIGALLGAPVPGGRMRMACRAPADRG
jgi:hypothetical protein